MFFVFWLLRYIRTSNARICGNYNRCHRAMLFGVLRECGIGVGGLRSLGADGTVTEEFLYSLKRRFSLRILSVELLFSACHGASRDSHPNLM